MEKIDKELEDKFVDYVVNRMTWADEPLKELETLFDRVMTRSVERFEYVRSN